MCLNNTQLETANHCRPSPRDRPIGCRVPSQCNLLGAVPVSRLAAAIHAPEPTSSAGLLLSGTPDRKHLNFDELLQPDGPSQGDACL